MLTGGDGEVLGAPPSSVRKGSPLETDGTSSEHRIFAFEEGTTNLTSDFGVDILVDLAGSASSVGGPESSPLGDFPMSGMTSAVGSIPSGTEIKSYYFTMDPSAGTPTRTASFEFPDEEIVGFTFINDGLDNSDLIVGAPGTLYPTGLIHDPNGSRKMETSADFFSYELNDADELSTLELTMRVDPQSLDNLRVFTVPYGSTPPIDPGVGTPEPSALLGLATLGLLGLATAKKRDSN